MSEIQSAETPVRRPWLRPALTAAAVATVAAVTFTVLPSTGDTAPRVTTAAAVLEDAALAAGEDTGYGEIRDDQFTYFENRTARQTNKGGKPIVGPLQREEGWMSVDGHEFQAPKPELADAFDFPYYDNLKSLPTDAQAMYDYLCKDSSVRFSINVGTENPVLLDKNQAMLWKVVHLTRMSVVPPEQAAALFRAVARIPGVTVIEDEADALGRHGVAIARHDDKQPLRMEWIFDEKTNQLLGYRMTVTRAFGGFKKGAVFDESAAVRRAVVDREGQRP